MTKFLSENLKRQFPIIVKGKGIYLYTNTGRKIIDAASGAAVTSIGHGNKRVTKAISKQLKSGTPYLSSAFWSNNYVEELCRMLIKSTNEKMAMAYLTGSGSEANEAAIKMSRQFYYEKDPNTPRVNFITRENSYHGNTIGALSLSGFEQRKKPYTPFLMKNVHYISPCYPYRQLTKGESISNFVSRKAKELEDKFIELGPNTVIAFIAEPVVGSALGCVESVPGYLQAMKNVCHKYGALFILDEIMCGAGRTGMMHAWQYEGVVPDIQTMAKGLGSGYQPIAAMLVNQTIIDCLMAGNGEFIHGLTYQAMPIQAAAALEVQKIILEENLLYNVVQRGAELGELLHNKLYNHPHVGDIRGKGLFWSIEFVRDKKSKVPFDPLLGIPSRILDKTLSHNMVVYPVSVTFKDLIIDHIILAPPFISKSKDIKVMANILELSIKDVFNNL